MKKKPLVLSTHGSLLGYKHYLPAGRAQLPYKFYDALSLRYAVRKADAIVVSSQMEYHDALDFGIDKGKLHVIPAGIDPQLYSRTPKHEHGDPLRILFAGRIARVRRVELVLRAVRQLTLPFHLTIAGGEETTSSVQRGGYLAELLKLTKTLGIEDQVSFIGRQSREDMRQVYRNADVFIYPSRYENFGQPILEAAATGLPVIATPVGVAQELIHSGETGFIVPADPNSISDRIMQLHDNDTRVSMGTTLQERALENFGWDRIIDQYIELYRSL